jgi:FAD:protein FMN transferase
MGCDVVLDGADVAALAAVEDLFSRRDRRFSRFRVDSELSCVNEVQDAPVLLSREFAIMLEVALSAAAATGGLVTPTVGGAVLAAGYDRDFSDLRDDRVPAGAADVPDWRSLRLVDRVLFRSRPVLLDLNGVVKGVTVDDAVAIVGSGTVAAGGDVATTRPVVVELPGGETITLRAGGLATSGTDRRRWYRGGELKHHLIDPVTGRPAASPWQTVTVAAGSCLAADVAAKAALLLGRAGPSWLDRRGLAGRFVSAGGNVTTNATWSLQTDARRAA